MLSLDSPLIKKLRTKKTPAIVFALVVVALLLGSLPGAASPAEGVARQGDDPIGVRALSSESVDYCLGLGLEPVQIDDDGGQVFHLSAEQYSASRDAGVEMEELGHVLTLSSNADLATLDSCYDANYTDHVIDPSNTSYINLSTCGAPVGALVTRVDYYAVYNHDYRNIASGCSYWASQLSIDLGNPQDWERLRAGNGLCCYVCGPQQERDLSATDTFAGTVWSALDGTYVRQNWWLRTINVCSCGAADFTLDYWTIRVYYDTPTPTRTSTRTPTRTRTATRTGTPSNTPTRTNTPTPSNTPTITPSPTPTVVPGIDIYKRLVDPVGGAVEVGQIATFDIAIRNSGDSLLRVIPLTDHYPLPCFEFVDSTPPPDHHNAALGELRWNDITLPLGDLAPGSVHHVIVRLRAIDYCPGIWLNCVQSGDAMDEFDQLLRPAGDCDQIEILPEPPHIEVFKEPRDPEICVGDDAIFDVWMQHLGPGFMTSLRAVDRYDTTYLEWLGIPPHWGPDDGELVEQRLFAWPVPAPALGLWEMRFRAIGATDSTVNEMEMTVNADPRTTQSDTAAVRILPEPGECEGNLVRNPGLEAGLADWSTLGTVRTSGAYPHSGGGAALLGILPMEADAMRLDVLSQVVQIPADAHDAYLTAWYFVDNHFDGNTNFNWFSAAIGSLTDPTIHHEIVAPVAFTYDWTSVTFDVSHLIGHDIGIGFAVWNDGDGTGPLWAYVDDVTICTAQCGPLIYNPPTAGGYDMCYKDSFPDYAPEGVPDFSQIPTVMPRQIVADGPAAAANSLWWYDSKFEPGAVPPPTVSDGYPLVEAYGDWDDHDVRNVRPLIADLAERVHTDGIVGHTGDWIGTRPDDMAAGVRDFIASKELQDDYAVRLHQAPSYELVKEKVARSEDVLLLLGLWENQPDGWRRIGGHWVTAVGWDCMDDSADGGRLAISDPIMDGAEAGRPGRYRPVVGHPFPHDDALHDDAAFVSHDVYNVWRTASGPQHGARFGLSGYAQPDPGDTSPLPDARELSEIFMGANVPDEFAEDQASEYQAGPIHVGVEYAVSVWHLRDAASLSLAPQQTNALFGQPFALDIIAESGVDPIESVQAYVNFDPDMLQVVDAAGDPATEIEDGDLTMTLQNAADNTSGQIDFAARTALGHPGAVGQVQVARIHFLPISTTHPISGTVVEFSWYGTRQTDVLAGATSILGHVDEAIVRCGEPATLRGQLNMQGRPPAPDDSWKIPMTVEVFEPGGTVPIETFSDMTTRDGVVRVDLHAGTYDVRVKGMHTLANRRVNLNLPPGVKTVAMGELLEGDVDNDNDIDAADASALNVAFASEPGDDAWDPRADLNEDGIVDAVDMNLLSANYGMGGDQILGAAPSAITEPSRSLSVAGLRITPNLGGGAPATIAFQPSSWSGQAGDTFTVDVVLQTGDHAVDAVDLSLSFPTHLVQIVDAGGNPAATVQSAGAFDTELANMVDPVGGMVHLAGTMTGTALTGDVTLATLRFKSLGLGQGRLRVSTWDPASAVYASGMPVLGTSPAGSISIAGDYGLQLPLVRN